jgi:hypothetical protein
MLMIHVNVNKYISVQKVMNEFDAREGDDPGGRGAEVVCFRLRLKVSIVGGVRVARSFEFQMTEAAERKEQGRW